MQRHIDLEYDGFAIGGGDFIGHDGLGFVDFRGTLKEFDAGEDADGVARRPCGKNSMISFRCGLSSSSPIPASAKPSAPWISIFIKSIFSLFPSRSHWPSATDATLA